MRIEYLRVFVPSCTRLFHYTGTNQKSRKLLICKAFFRFTVMFVPEI